MTAFSLFALVIWFTEVQLSNILIRLSIFTEKAKLPVHVHFEYISADLVCVSLLTCFLVLSKFCTKAVEVYWLHSVGLCDTSRWCTSASLRWNKELDPKGVIQIFHNDTDAVHSTGCTYRALRLNAVYWLVIRYPTYSFVNRRKE
jgi:hypothetical protein